MFSNSLKPNKLLILILIIFFISLYFLIQHSYVLTETFDAIYRISSLNDKKYKIRSEFKDIDKTPDVLATIEDNIFKLVNYLQNTHPSDERIIRMHKRLQKLKIEEAKHENNSSSYTINKGELMNLCLRDKTTKDFHDINTLMFVVIHELAHIMTISTGHTDEFLLNFKFILSNAVDMGVYTPIDYKNNPITYCGVKVNHNPYF